MPNIKLATGQIKFTRSQSERNINSQREAQREGYPYKNNDEEVLKGNNIRMNQTSNLTKTFSQAIIQSNRLPFSDETRGKRTNGVQAGWMKMSFEERQSKTVENRRQKSKEGLKLKDEKETKGCTFKPQINMYRGKGRQETASSYAKLYMQKIKKRF